MVTDKSGADLSVDSGLFHRCKCLEYEPDAEHRRLQLDPSVMDTPDTEAGRRDKVFDR